MERFDAEEALALIERYRVTHSQLVPTMFVRMLKLTRAVRAPVRPLALQSVIHAAAPCPVEVKRQMIEWWGPILHEYYGGTEGNGYDLHRRRGVAGPPGLGRAVVVGELHIVDDDGRSRPAGQTGHDLVRARTAEFEYLNDPDKTAGRLTQPTRRLATLGDVGYLDEDGYLYLTDRKATYMIISGGVNIYPQEIENVLVTHPKVADAAVFGIPNEDFGEEVKAVVQLSTRDRRRPGWRPSWSRSAASTSPTSSAPARSTSWTSCPANPPGIGRVLLQRVPPARRCAGAARESRVRRRPPASPGAELS